MMKYEIRHSVQFDEVYEICLEVGAAAKALSDKEMEYIEAQIHELCREFGWVLGRKEPEIKSDLFSLSDGRNIRYRIEASWDEGTYNAETSKDRREVKLILVEAVGAITPLSFGIGVVPLLRALRIAIVANS